MTLSKQPILVFRPFAGIFNLKQSNAAETVQSVNKGINTIEVILDVFLIIITKQKYAHNSFGIEYQ